MIAGEMDISIAAMIPAGSMRTAILSSHLALGMTVGLVNGLLIGGSQQVISLWWLGVTLARAFVLHLSPVRNWIFAMGGDKVSARNAGIPTRKLTLTLLLAVGMKESFRKLAMIARRKKTPAREP